MNKVMRNILNKTRELLAVDYYLHPNTSRNNYKLCLIKSISSCIYRQKSLRTIWENCGLSYNQMVQINYEETTPGNRNYLPILTPVKGFHIENVAIILSDNQLFVNIEMPLNPEGVDEPFGKYITGGGMLILQDSLKNEPNFILAASIDLGIKEIKSDE